MTKASRLNSIRTLFLLAMAVVIAVLSLPLLYSGSRILDRIIHQSGAEILTEKLHSLIGPVNRRYETLRRVGLEDSQVHLDEIKADALADFSRFRYMETGAVFVIGQDGAIVLSKNFRSAAAPDFKPFFATLGRQPHGLTEYTANGAKRLAVFLFYEPWQSYVGISVSEEELFAPKTLFIRINLLVLALVGMIAACFTLGLQQLIILPLIRLTRFATRISKGDFSATPSGTFILELALLKEDISAMIASLRRQTEETARQLVVIRQREEELAQAFAALEESRERLAVTLQSIGDGVITTDIDGHIMLLNGVAQKMTGWSQAEAEGRPLAEVLRIVDAHSGAACADPVRQVLDAQTTIDFGRHTLLVGRDRADRPIADSSAPIRDQSGNIIGVVLVFRDMTEALRSEEERIKIKKLESVGVLAAGIAHDFNNLLAAILGNLDLAHLLVPEEHETAKLLAEAKKAALRAKGLTQQLLTFAKGGAPVRQVAAIGTVIRDSADFVLRGSNVTCGYDIPDDLWLVAIDQGQMSQVIQNIILNARQAMPDGGAITVTCRNLPAPQADGNRVAIAISDNGPGMPAATLEHIFDPYYTTRSEGSGLGLAICHSIVTKHHGTIEVVSRPGKGTTFTILLPGSGETMADEAPAEKEIRPERRLRVLLMDDEEMVREISRQMLEHLGHTVQTAAEGREAIAAYKEAMASGRGFDLAIVDLTIPGGMGGKEAVGEIRALDPGARVLVASGYADNPVMADCTAYGFVGCVKKPFLLAELEEAIRQAITHPALPTA